MCSGCGQPRVESFDPVNDDRYDVEVLQCHACAARERRSWNRSQGRDSGTPPPMGEYFAVSGPNLDD